MQQGQAFRDSLLSELLPLRVLTKVGAAGQLQRALLAAAGRGAAADPRAPCCAQVAHVQWQVLVFPYTVSLYCLSWFAALLLRFLVVAGAPPADYTNKAKARLPRQRPLQAREVGLSVLAHEVWVELCVTAFLLGWAIRVCRCAAYAWHCCSSLTCSIRWCGVEAALDSRVLEVRVVSGTSASGIH